MNFDEVIDRRGTGCLKWDRAAERYDVPDGNLAMWVADMDFRAPDAVLDAARKRIDDGVFGYGTDMDAYHDAIAWWMETRHGWRPDPGHILTTTGLCNAIAIVIEALTDPGDAVLIFSPVYHAFARTIRGTGREVVEAVLHRDGARYVMDFGAAEHVLTGREKILLFCSPHNPVGRVWSREELGAAAAFAEAHGMIFVSDEIHHDLVFDGNEHTVMPHADIDPSRLIMLTAASKTFNLAGMATGNIIISDDTLRARVAKRLAAVHASAATLGIDMTAAAYSPDGAKWVDALVDYLDGNRKRFDAGIDSIPGLSSIPLEATFLAWVDFSGTGMSQKEIHRRVERKAGIAANHGATFGPGGEDFMRFNIGTQRARIDEALERLSDAFADLQ